MTTTPDPAHVAQRHLQRREGALKPTVNDDGSVTVGGYTYEPNDTDQFVDDITTIGTLPQRLSRREYEQWARRMGVKTTPDPELGSYADRYGDYDFGTYFAQVKNRKKGWELTLRQRRWWAYADELREQYSEKNIRRMLEAVAKHLDHYGLTAAYHPHHRDGYTLELYDENANPTNASTGALTVSIDPQKPTQWTFAVHVLGAVQDTLPIDTDPKTVAKALEALAKKRGVL